MTQSQRALGPSRVLRGTSSHGLVYAATGSLLSDVGADLPRPSGMVRPCTLFRRPVLPRDTPDHPPKLSTDSAPPGRRAVVLVLAVDAQLCRRAVTCFIECRGCLRPKRPGEGAGTTSNVLAAQGVCRGRSAAVGAIAAAGNGFRHPTVSRDLLGNLVRTSTHRRCGRDAKRFEAPGDRSPVRSAPVIMLRIVAFCMADAQSKWSTPLHDAERVRR